MDVANIIGYIGSVAMILGYLPQAIITMRTRSTDDIGLTTFVMMTVGALCFAIQGYMIDNIPIMVTNAITSSSSLVIAWIKIYNDFFKKPRNKKH